MGSIRHTMFQVRDGGELIGLARRCCFLLEDAIRASFRIWAEGGWGAKWQYIIGWGGGE